MTDIVAAAVITVSGMVAVGAISALVQLAITKHVVNSEHRKIMLQVREESTARVREKRFDMLREVIVEFTSLLDPDISTDIDIARMTYLINKAQILLDPNVEQEKLLFDRLIELGVLISGYAGPFGVKEWLHPENKSESLKMLANFVGQARAVFTLHGR